MFYLTLLPSTVQSSIAFTSVARGNVAAAVCSASLSNLLGVVLTPVLVALLLAGSGGGFSGSAVLDLVLQLIVPFAIGQLCRPWLSEWVRRRAGVLKVVDRGSILLVVYTAFSQGIREGIWSQITVGRLLILMAACTVLLAVVMVATWIGSRVARFDRADRIVVLFCGSKKSLATGLPMATVLFAGHSVGLLVLPLMLFHQLQLLVCAAIASRMSSRDNEGSRPERPAAGDRQQGMVDGHDSEPTAVLPVVSGPHSAEWLATVPFAITVADLMTAPLPHQSSGRGEVQSPPRHARSQDDACPPAPVLSDTTSRRGRVPEA